MPTTNRIRIAIMASMRDDKLERTKSSGPPQAYGIDGTGGNMTLALNTIPSSAEAGNEIRLWTYREVALLTGV